MKLKQLLFILTFALFATNFYAADLYVGSTVADAGATLGSQNNPHPLLSDAVTAAVDGDRIIIVGSINQNAQIIFNKAITFEGQSNAVINGAANRLFNISAGSGKSISFSNITFQNMNAGFQGAVLNSSSQNGMTFTFTNCNFLNNTTTATGGVFYFANTSTITITGCTFYNNKGGVQGGAIQLVGFANATITNCTFHKS
jgi:hypothetical protein